MSTNPYALVRVSGLRISTRRAVAFLRCDGNQQIDAMSVFDGLKKERERELRERLDYWIDGGTHDKYFHGWPNNPVYKQCFVFKWKENRMCHRMYGFLIHPTPNLDASFQVCVLVSHASKAQWDTDIRELDGSKALSKDPLVIAAVAEEFPDSTKDRKKWLN